MERYQYNKVVFIINKSVKKLSKYSTEELVIATVQYSTSILNNPYKPFDIKEMGKHLNAYSHMYNMLYNPIFKDFDYLKPNSPLNIKITELLPKLHQQIFPWAFESDWKILRDKSKGKGIVFTAGLFILI